MRPQRGPPQRGRWLGGAVRPERHGDLTGTPQPHWRAWRVYVSAVCQRERIERLGGREWGRQPRSRRGLGMGSRRVMHLLGASAPPGELYPRHLARPRRAAWLNSHSTVYTQGHGIHTATDTAPSGAARQPYVDERKAVQRGKRALNYSPRLSKHKISLLKKPRSP